MNIFWVQVTQNKTVSWAEEGKDVWDIMFFLLRAEDGEFAVSIVQVWFQKLQGKLG